MSSIPIELMTVQEIITHLQTRLGAFVFLGVTGQDNETTMAMKHVIIRCAHGPDVDRVVLADRLRDIIIHEACQRTQYKATGPRPMVEDVARSLILQTLLKNTTQFNSIIPLEGYGDADVSTSS